MVTDRTGGFRPTQVKKEKGARFGTRSVDRVLIQPMGRGTMVAISNLYVWAASSWSALRIIVVSSDLYAAGSLPRESVRDRSRPEGAHRSVSKTTWRHGAAGDGWRDRISRRLHCGGSRSRRSTRRHRMPVPSTPRIGGGPPAPVREIQIPHRTFYALPRPPWTSLQHSHG